LTTLPESLGQLAQLLKLDEAQNKLKTLPEALGHLAQLQELHVWGSQLTTLPESLGRLTQLRKLDASRNQLTTLPEWIGRLAQLQGLYIWDNQLTILPESLGQLAQLQQLSVSKNGLTTLPEWIGRLAQLQEFHAWGNQLTTLPDSLGRLARLRNLDVSHNKLTTLPEWVGQLAQLQELYIWDNQLTTLPESLGRLAQLRQLNASQNKLLKLPDSIGRLRSLKQLFLHGNPELGLGPEWLGPDWRGVFYAGEEAARKPADILNYYFRLSGVKRPLNEAKLILVGLGGVGKTSLVKQLLGEKFDPKEDLTPGIQITPWTIQVGCQPDTVWLNIWDFGGQEIMHATHQFFLTERSLYLLVLNARDGDQDANIEYWLRIIESFGAESPVIVVINKIKDHRLDLNCRGLKEKFPAIRHFVLTDCKDSIGIDELGQLIREETNRLEHLRDPFPATWFAIKNRLATLPENYITYEQYRKICAEDGESDPQGQDTLVGFLHNIGIVVNFKDDPRLRERSVLKPEWVTNGIYTLLNASGLIKNHGDLRIEQLSDLLDRRTYPREAHGYLMDLMCKFELCFEFEGERGHYLIPELLGKEEPHWKADFPPERCLNFRYHYNILPQGLVPRFIVRTHERSRGQPRWRMGVIMEYDGNQALVRADVQDRKLFISVDGPEAGRRLLLAIVRENFDRIHGSIAKLRADEYVPVPGRPHVVLDYRKLLVREASGKDYVEFEDSDEVIEEPLGRLLDGIESPEKRQERRRHEEGNDPTSPPLRATRTILILAANPESTTRLKLDQEENRIKDAIKRARLREEFRVEVERGVTDDRLRQAILDHRPAIVHFCGHGLGSSPGEPGRDLVFEDETKSNGLVFEDEFGHPRLIPGEPLADLFRLCAVHVRCVVLNACYSQVQADAIVQHIDYVIGMQRAIGDQAAIRFAQGFYDALGAGEDYRTAFGMGRNAIGLRGIPESLTPVLRTRG
jgi:internalin A